MPACLIGSHATQKSVNGRSPGGGNVLSKSPQVTPSTSKHQHGGEAGDREITRRQQQLSHGPQLADGMDDNREHRKT